MEPTDDFSKVNQLEKKVRALTKKLERSEADRQELEMLNDRRQSVLKNVILELEQSKTVLEIAVIRWNLPCVTCKPCK